MVPIRDVNPVRSVPVVNYGLILGNVVAFLWMHTLPGEQILEWAVVPRRLLADPIGEAITIPSSLFLHANLSHLGGNMLFLWIFGDNIEDSLGRRRYLAFYLLGGVVAAFTQVAMSTSSEVPMVGASGAIAAVTGAYLVLFPRAPILVLNPVIPLWLFMGITFLVPAWVVVGEFFLMNVLLGVQTLGEQALTGAEFRGGVAVFAHLGGFVIGLLMIHPFQRGRIRRQHRDWDGWRPPPRARR